MTADKTNPETDAAATPDETDHTDAGTGQPAPEPARGSDAAPPSPPEEQGGPSGPDPTRFGDWERKGRCIDF